MIYEVSPLSSEYQGPTVFDVVRGTPYDGPSGQVMQDRKPLDPIFRPPFSPYKIDYTNKTICIKKGWVLGISPETGTLPMNPIAPTINLSDMDGGGSGNPMSTDYGETIYCRVATDGNDLVTSATIVSKSYTPFSTHAQPAKYDIDGVLATAAVNGDYYYPLLDFESNAPLRIKNVYHYGTMLIHRPGRTGATGHLHLLDCSRASIAFLDFKQGQFTSIITPDGHQEVEAGCDGTSSS